MCADFCVCSTSHSNAVHLNISIDNNVVDDRSVKRPFIMCGEDQQLQQNSKAVALEAW